MPMRAARSEMLRGRPPLGLGGSAGKSGATISHRPSLINGVLMPLIYHEPEVVLGALKPFARLELEVEDNLREAAG